MKLDPRLSFCIVPNSEWDKDLNTRPDILNLIEEEVGNALKLTGTGLVLHTLRTTTDKWDLMKLKPFCPAKNTII